MQPYIWISLLFLILVVIVTLVVAAIATRKSIANSDLIDSEKHPKGYWISTGISIGAGFGVALGLVFDNLALGIAMGAGFGIAIGSALEQQNKDKLRPLSEPEKRLQRWGLIAGLLMLLIVAGLFIFLLFSRGV